MNSCRQWLVVAAVLATWGVTDIAAAQVTISGVVQNGSSTPVPGTLLEFKQGPTVVDTDTSAADGSYSVSLPTGSYSLTVTPPGASGYVPQTQSGLSFTQNATLNVVLIPAGSFVYAGKLVDRNGTGVPMHTVRLNDNAFQYDDTTAVGGDFSVTASSSDQTVNVRCDSCLSGSEYLRLYFPNVDLSAGSVSGATLTLEDRVLSGTLTDNLGAPVVNANLSWSQNVSYQAGLVTGYDDDYLQTNAQGQFTFRVFPGNGTLNVTAPSGSGLGNKVVNVTVPDQAGDPAALNIMLAVAPSFAGKLVDRNGTGVPMHTVRLNDNAFQYDDTTAVGGDFSVTASSSDQTVNVRCDSCLSGSEYLRLYFPNVDLSAGSVSGATLTLEDRVLSGTLTDNLGAPVVNANLSWSQNVSYQAGLVTGYDDDYLQTNAQGQFTFRVFPGNGTLSVTAPSGSGLGNKVVNVTVPDQAGDPAALNIMLAVAPSFAGKLVDRNGTGVPMHTVRLNDNAFQYDDTTAVGGDFSVTASSSDQTVNVRCDSCLSGSEYLRLYFPNVDLSAGSVSGATLTLEDRVLSGAVTDVDDKPIVGVNLSWSQNVSYQAGLVTGYDDDYLQTDAQGKFTFRVFPGTGTLQATPPASTGLAPFNISNMTISGDQSLAILVQFVSEATSMTVGAGGTVSSDPEADGATPDDPVETAVTVPAGGMVTIEERPLSTLPPVGFQFLTQEIAIVAPAASAADPLIVVFDLDSSRVPLGVDQTTLYAFRNGVPLPNCTGAAGQASPNPCIDSRVLLGDGDIRLVALTSAASVWNLGILTIPTSCGDGTLDVGEDCDDNNNAGGDCCAANCTFETSGAACSDSLACTTSDTCNGAGTCQSGAPVVCTAQSQCHDVGVCNPGTGQCSNPAKTAGAACGDSSDTVCTDPDTCNGSGVCLAYDVAGCCLADAACADSNACTADTCKLSSNTCENVAIADCCTLNSQCDDGDACTADKCRTDNACAFTAIADCCTADGDCDDGDDCTMDVCDSDDTCSYAAIASCGATPADDDAGPSDPPVTLVDSGSPDSSVGVPKPDAGGSSSRGTDASTSQDAGMSMDPDVGCQCSMQQNGRPLPLGGVLLGLLISARLMRRRRKRATANDEQGDRM